MLNCRQVTERASEYLDREASAMGRLQMRLHLLLCRACRQYVQQLEVTREALRALARDDVGSVEPARAAFRRWRADLRE